MHDLMRELFPIPRSLTGDGVRESLRRLAREVPLELVETPSGTQVFDWTLPPEWNIRDAWIEGPDGQRVLELADNTLHVLGYSTPLRATMPLAELREHVFTHPDEPGWIPYRTSYYEERWGFCMEQRRLDSLADGDYEVCIDSTLAPGSVTYGEAFLPGETDDEVLLSTYVCHPALANDNLSGVVLLAQLGKLLAGMRLRYGYRLLWSPGTIGPLTWLWRNQDDLRVRHGLVASCVGDPGAITYKRSRREDADVDRAVAIALRDSGREHAILPWFPWGGDERQFCSPGFDLPVGALSRTPADKFRGYHSSADDLELVRPEALADSLTAYLEVIDVLESNRVFRSTNPHGEPQLGKRGLYRGIGGGSSRELALLWVLSLADGEHDLIAMAERSGLRFAELRDAAGALVEHDLLVEA